MSLIPEQVTRHARRAAEVGAILAKYGLADWLAHTGFPLPRGLLASRDGEPLTTQSRPARIRLAISELGTTFIKLGQMLSTRGDLVGEEIAEELAKLQTDAPPSPPEVAMATIQTELGRPLQEVFAEFVPAPMASASIGQVHRARLHDGTAVVVKVQHPDIEDRVRPDLETLRFLAGLAENSTLLKRYQPRALVAEFHRSLLRELDFDCERRNIERFTTNFRANPKVRFPRVHADLSTSRVLTMEFLEGVSLRDTGRLDRLGVDRDELARRGATVWLDMLFRDGFYHADPHPGNLLVMNDATLGIIDCGMAGQIDEDLRENIEDLLVAIAALDAPMLAGILTRLCAAPPGFDEAGFRADLADFISYYGSQPIERFQLGGALNEIARCISRYQLMLPSSIARILKVLAMLDGTAKLLSPTQNLISIIRPYQRQILRRQLSPRRMLRKLHRFASEWREFAEHLPRSLANLLRQVQEGRFDVHLEHRRLEPSVNRLVMGLVSSALFLGSSLLLSSRVPPLAGEHSIPGAAGLTVSGLLVFRLIWKVWRNE